MYRIEQELHPEMETRCKINVMMENGSVHPSKNFPKSWVPQTDTASQWRVSHSLPPCSTKTKLLEGGFLWAHPRESFPPSARRRPSWGWQSQDSLATLMALQSGGLVSPLPVDLLKRLCEILCLWCQSLIQGGAETRKSKQVYWKKMFFW